LKFPKINSIFIIFNVFFDKISQYILYKKIVFLVLTCSQQGHQLFESFIHFVDFLKDFWTNWNAVLSDMLACSCKMELFLGDGKWFVEEGVRQGTKFYMGVIFGLLPHWGKKKKEKKTTLVQYKNNFGIN
jgi:hypothetical protein